MVKTEKEREWDRKRKENMMILSFRILLVSK
jgi:hypothetical protein